MSDLRDRIAQTLATHVWEPGHDWSDTTAHTQHRYSGLCAICRGDTERIADAVMGVIAHLSDLETDLQHAERENRRLRQELAKIKGGA